MRQKCAEELCVIALKNDEKFEEELTFALKNDMGNLVNFTGTLKSLKMCSLRYFFVQGIECLSQKNYRGVIYHGTEGLCNI